jgi:di/tricarboxylate transporter
MMQIALVLILLLVIIVLFSLDRIPLELVALGLLSILLLSGVISPAQAFAGFGSDTVIMIVGLFVMTEALVRTGVVESLSRILRKRGGSDPFRLNVLMMLLVTLLSAFISNTAATAVFVPLVMGLARRSGFSPSKFLMPLAFASILSSSVTLISTSTNIVISGLLAARGYAPMGMFELAPVGVPIVCAGLIYMITLGLRLLPERAGDNLAEDYHLRDYLTELVVLPDSPVAGRTLAETRLASDRNLSVIKIIREGGKQLLPHGREVLRAGDVLVVEASADEILRIQAETNNGLEVLADYELPANLFSEEQAQLVEVMIMPGSELRGRTLTGLRFHDRFGLAVLAINRRGVTLHEKLSRIPLRVGDVLLLQGSSEDVRRLEAEGSFSILSDVSERRPRSPKARYAIIIFLLTIGIGACRIIPFASAIMVGTFLMLLVRAISPPEAWSAVEWKVVILIGAMFAFGVALEQTGAAGLIARGIVRYAGGAGPLALLAAFFVLTVALTQPMSNQAAALVLLPVALETATQLQLNPRSFAMMIAIAASCSYLTPLEPSCILVYGPGRYKFRDFFKVGALLTVIIFIVAMLLVPQIWPLKV